MVENNTPEAAASTVAARGPLLNGRFWQLGLARLHHERLIERIPIAFDVGCRGLLARGVFPVVADQRAGDAELDVCLKLVVVRRVDLRDQRLEAFPENEEVQMRRAEIV